ncbi:MAG: DUF2335 domain-containing protein [Planctomycetaceae bacterium]|nr:MAG: DUF2335 domain-containing protein [Planctomycetaceae bacterium]
MDEEPTPRPDEISPRRDADQEGSEPAADQSAQAFFRRQIVKTIASSGPLPLPSVLAEYDAIVPGSAERIIGWAERQSEHRMSLERSVVDSDIRRSYLGMGAGFTIALVFGIGGCIVAALGQPTAGATIATGCIVSLVSVFVYGTRSRRQERQDRAKLMSGQEPSQADSSEVNDR